MAAQKEKAPVKYYEVVDKAPSGFIMDGTENTPFQQQLMVPSIQWISSKGQACQKDNTGIKHYVEVQYLHGCDSIYPDEQLKRGYTAKRMMDKIPIENGFMNVVREGSTIGLYDYLEKVFFNLDNPDRPDTAAARYREVKLDKKAEELMDEDEFITKAKTLVYELRVNTGKNTEPYRYHSDRIDSICRLVGVWDETDQRKLILLLNKANSDPKGFLELVSKTEQTVITELSHALELKIIHFTENTAVFTEGAKVIYSVEGSKLKPDQKMEKLAYWLNTDAGTPSLTEIRAKLEIEKEKLS